MNDIPIPVTQLIRIDNPEQYKLHAARCNSDGEEPLDVYVQNKKKWFDWNRWRGTRDDFNRQYIFSLIDFYHETDVWLFGGIYEVTGRKDDPNDYSYSIKELDQYSGYVGRLKIELKAPRRGRAFKLEKHLDKLDKMKISEILKRPYSGEVFPGYESINHDFNILAPIFNNENPDWKTALENVKGVYVVTDKSSGMRYVGAAHSGEGIWSRWSDHIKTGHGGNKALKKLIQQKGEAYARENFSISLLEYRPMKTDDQAIFARESFWKKVFLSREFGHNRN